jgi:hypothetical protein
LSETPWFSRERGDSAVFRFKSSPLDGRNGWASTSGASVTRCWSSPPRQKRTFWRVGDGMRRAARERGTLAPDRGQRAGPMPAYTTSVSTSSAITASVVPVPPKFRSKRRTTV